MNKQGIMEQIKEAQSNVEELRSECIRIKSEGGSEYKRLSNRFEVDLAYRNGLIHALLLSEECNDSDMEYLRSLPNKPMIWSGMLYSADSETPR